tara:strand:- start:1527 stop:1832 length:306 start_codon:yes stop_codon:yes gene_type:complete
LHRLLAGEAVDDPELAQLWIVSRICEEFTVTPQQAERLLLDDPEDRALDIVELRAYAAAKAHYDQAGGKVDELEQTPMMDQVIENVFALHKARVAARKGRD